MNNNMHLFWKIRQADVYGRVLSQADFLLVYRRPRQDVPVQGFAKSASTDAGPQSRIHAGLRGI